MTSLNMADIGQVIEDDIQIIALIMTHVGHAIADGIKILGHLSGHPIPL